MAPEMRREDCLSKGPFDHRVKVRFLRPPAACSQLLRSQILSSRFSSEWPLSRLARALIVLRCHFFIQASAYLPALVHVEYRYAHPIEVCSVLTNRTALESPSVSPPGSPRKRCAAANSRKTVIRMRSSISRTRRRSNPASSAPARCAGVCSGMSHVLGEPADAPRWCEQFLSDTIG